MINESIWENIQIHYNYIYDCYDQNERIKINGDLI